MFRRCLCEYAAFSDAPFDVGAFLVHTDRMINSFEALGLSEKILAAVEDMQYSEPTPVQAKAIPFALEGRDVVAAAQTGTGKTAAFVLPTMQRIGRSKKAPLALVVTPTRELAQQIDKVATTVGKRTGQRVVTVVGGVGYEPQIKKLARGCEVLVATPGRLLDLKERGNVDLSQVQVLILDEADRMLDMGFLPAMRKIISFVPHERQTLLFSATIDENVMSAVGSLLKDPEYIEISRKGTTASTVEQKIMPVDHVQKPDLLIELLKERGPERVIVFTRTKHRADSVAKRLAKQGYKTSAIHADRSQSQRQKALEDFRMGKVDILVATDVLSRGIDISEVSHVINYDVPTNPEDYVHRIGRTGRAGETGYALTFVGPDEITALRDIEYLLEKLIDVYDIPGFAYRDSRIIPFEGRPTKKQSRSVFGGRRKSSGARRR